MIRILQAELTKQKHSPILWVSFVAFALAPLMGGLFMLIAKNPEAMAQNGMLKQKAEMMAFVANWNSYLGILSQAMGVGGILLFGFVASWVFGREYTDRTATDLLSLPVSRAQMIHAKFVTYAGWCLSLAISNLLILLMIGAMLKLDGWNEIDWSEHATRYGITTLLTLAACMPVAFFAMVGRGYLAPLGFTALTLVLAQVLAAAGVGQYVPWSVPGLYSGAGGEYKALLNSASYAEVVLVAIAGYAACIIWWQKADQK